MSACTPILSFQFLKIKTKKKEEELQEQVLFSLLDCSKQIQKKKKKL